MVNVSELKTGILNSGCTIGELFKNTNVLTHPCKFDLNLVSIFLKTVQVIISPARSSTTRLNKWKAKECKWAMPIPYFPCFPEEESSFTFTRVVNDCLWNTVFTGKSQGWKHRKFDDFLPFLPHLTWGSEPDGACVICRFIAPLGGCPKARTAERPRSKPVWPHSSAMCLH